VKSLCAELKLGFFKSGAVQIIKSGQISSPPNLRQELSAKHLANKENETLSPPAVLSELSISQQAVEELKV